MQCRTMRPCERTGDRQGSVAGAHPRRAGQQVQRAVDCALHAGAAPTVGGRLRLGRLGLRRIARPHPPPSRAQEQHTAQQPEREQHEVGDDVARGRLDVDHAPVQHHRDPAREQADQAEAGGTQQGAAAHSGLRACGDVGCRVESIRFRAGASRHRRACSSVLSGEGALMREFRARGDRGDAVIEPVTHNEGCVHGRAPWLGPDRAVRHPLPAAKITGPAVGFTCGPAAHSRERTPGRRSSTCP